MFGGKKKKLLSEGAQASAVVINVQDTGITVNNNPRVKLTLQVQPEGDAPFEVTKKQTVSRVAIPRVGDQFLVRYDPSDHSQVEFDQAAVRQANQAAEAQLAQAAAAQIPPDLAANGILGRGAVVDVQQTPTGQLVDCAVTVGVRLTDGSPVYRTTARVSLSPDNATRLVAGQTVLTVRADPQNRERVAISLSEPTPSVAITDPAVIDPPSRALREGTACRVTLLAHGQQFLHLPTGEELYAAKVRVDDGSELEILLPVPDSASGLLSDGRDYPAKRLPLEPGVLTVDWEAAQQEAGAVL